MAEGIKPVLDLIGAEADQPQACYMAEADVMVGRCANS